MRAHHHGALATISCKFAGYPFGSAVPYILDEGACPVILISALAEHTKNIEAERRVSLLVQEHSIDPQASARITLLGDAARAEDTAGLLSQRYLAYFPDAERLLEMGDFSWFRIQPLALRFIGGFGEVRWIDAADYALPAHDIAPAEQALIHRINQMHGKLLSRYCSMASGREVERSVAIALDCDGLDLRADGELLRIDFDHPIVAATEAATAVLRLLQRERPA